MKAIETSYYVTPYQAVLHKDVVEVESTHMGYHFFRCKCCGHKWKQTLNSPQIIEDEVANNIKEYVTHNVKVIDCTEVYK